MDSNYGDNINNINHNFTAYGNA